MTIEDFKYDHPDRDVAAFKRAVANKLIYAVGKDPVAASPDDWLHAAALAVRDQLVERWMGTTRAQLRAGAQARLLPVDGVPDRAHLHQRAARARTSRAR